MIALPKVQSVSELNLSLKRYLGSCECLENICVSGEIADLKISQNGHAFFKLKDATSQIACVIFAREFAQLSYSPKNGDGVVLFGSIDFYTNKGEVNFKVSFIEKKGEGKILLDLEKLKQKLKVEGLFDETKKRPINPFPKAIGLITGKSSAAEKDLVVNISRRYPLCDILIFNSLVQGEEASKSLVKALKLASTYDLTTIILARGGGSSDDISAFNDEEVVRAVASCQIPIISAIGHETDYTLVDLASDLRVSTPTGAAEAATSDKEALLKQVGEYNSRLINNINNKIENLTNKVEYFKEKIFNVIKENINQKMFLVDKYFNSLKALSSDGVLKRGYSITTDSYGKTISSIKSVIKGDKIKIILNDGIINGVVEDING